MSKYKVQRTYLQTPWRYWVYEGGYPIALTFTKWGAERLIRKMARMYGDD